MTDYFVGPDGDNANSGLTEELAKADLVGMNGVGAITDTIIILDGEIRSVGSVRHRVDEARVTIKSQNYRGAILQNNGVYAVNVVELDGAGLTSADSPLILEDFIIDQENNATSGLQIDRDAGDTPPEIVLNNLLFDNCVNLPISHAAREGRLTMNNIEVNFGDNNPTVVMNPGSGALSQDGPQNVVLNGFEFACTVDGSATTFFQFQKHDNVSNALTMICQRVRATIRHENPTGLFNGIKLSGISDGIVQDCDITLTVPVNTGNSSTCINIVGRTGLVNNPPGDDCAILNNRVSFQAPLGYGISFGVPETPSNMSGGRCSGNYVYGQYWASNAPHGIAMAEDTSADCYSNTVENIYVGLLISQVTTCNVVGNLAIDCYGSSIYAKGCKGATLIQGNTCVVSRGTLQRQLGILAMVAQGADDNTDTDYIENIVIVQRWSDIGGCLGQKDLNQVGTFQRNTYYVPIGSFDVTTEQVFRYESASNNYTLAQWNAETEITDDRIIFLPQSKIDEMVAYHRVEADGAAGRASGTGQAGVVRGIVRGTVR